MQDASTGYARSLRVFAAVLENRGISRVEGAFIGFNVAESGTWVAIMVFAFGVGSVGASGTIGAIQLVPAAIVAPFAALLGDRYRRDHVMVAGYLLQALTVIVAGVALLYRVPLPLIYLLAAAATMSITLTRPVQSALLPMLAQTTEQLTAANVAEGWIEGISLFAGPVLTGILLTVSSPGIVFLVMGLVLLCSAFLASGVTAPVVPAPDFQSEGSTITRDLLGGFSTLVHDGRPRLIVSLMGAHFLLVGALEILLVVLAIRLLGIGSGGVGFLTAAFGVGGLVGAAITVLLIGRPRLALPLLAGAMAWGAGLCLLSIAPNRLLAPILVALAGAGRPLFDVAGRTLLQRLVADDAMSRVFGILEGFSTATEGVGMILVPLLFAVLRDRFTFIAIGVFLPILILITWRRLSAVDAGTTVSPARLSLLRALPDFALLAPPVLERLARRLIPIDVAAGSAVIQQGERGNRFYIISEGRVSVLIDGRAVRTMEPGEYFGEVALLYDVPRTATVLAMSDLHLYALERADFLEAITGNPHIAEAMDASSRARLEAQPAEMRVHAP